MTRLGLVQVVPMQAFSVFVCVVQYGERTEVVTDLPSIEQRARHETFFFFFGVLNGPIIRRVPQPIHPTKYIHCKAVLLQT